jgi:hypothetical protein
MSQPHQISKDGGVQPLEQVPMMPGASSQRESAYLHGQENAARQNQMNKTGGKRGKSRRRRKVSKQGGGSGSLQVPKFSTGGAQVIAPSMNANASSQSTNTTLTQGNADAVCDNCIGSNQPSICNTPECNPQMGGGKNGNVLGPNQTWGCMSGGKRTRRRMRKSRRKIKKSKKKVRRSNKKRTNKKIKK